MTNLGSTSTTTRSENRVFIRSVNKTLIIETHLISAISNIWSNKIKATQLRIHPSKHTCTIETTCSNSAEYIIENIQQLESKLNYPITANLYVKDYQRKANNTETKHHAMAKDVPLDYSNEEISDAIQDSIGKRLKFIL